MVRTSQRLYLAKSEASEWFIHSVASTYADDTLKSKFQPVLGVRSIQTLVKFTTWIATLAHKGTTVTGQVFGAVQILPEVAHQSTTFAKKGTIQNYSYMPLRSRARASSNHYFLVRHQCRLSFKPQKVNKIYDRDQPVHTNDKKKVLRQETLIYAAQL